MNKFMKNNITTQNLCEKLLNETCSITNSQCAYAQNIKWACHYYRHHIVAENQKKHADEYHFHEYAMDSHVQSPSAIDRRSL